MAVSGGRALVAIFVKGDQQLWGVALWVEKHHGADGASWIAEQIGRLALARDESGVNMRRSVADRLQQLKGPEMSARDYVAITRQ